MSESKSSKSLPPGSGGSQPREPHPLLGETHSPPGELLRHERPEVYKAILEAADEGEIERLKEIAFIILDREIQASREAKAK